MLNPFYMKHLSLFFSFFFFLSIKSEATLLQSAIGTFLSPDSVIPNPNDTIDYSYQELDDKYLENLERLIEMKEKEKDIKQVIDNYENVLLKKEMTFDWWSVLPLVRGGLLSSTTSNFKSRDVLFEHHKSDKWEYGAAMIPFAVSWGLKAAGVESRSKTKRMALANAIGLGFTCGFTELLKHTADETRPDGHDNHSMPSGHSALAFFSATVLDREFGHHSPWISVGGYAAALFTQYNRIHHNHHYLNDVITGAGIGTLSANLGYFITDKFFGADGIKKPKVSMTDFRNFQKYVQRPTSFSLLSGFSTGYNLITPSSYVFVGEAQDIQLRTTAGYKTTCELSCFLNSYWAIEAMASMAQYKVQTISSATEKDGIFGNNIYQYHLDLGGKFSYPVNAACRFEARAFAGERMMPSVDFLFYNGSEALQLKKSNDFEFGAGIGINMLSSSKYVTGVSCDYVHACSSLMKNRWVIGSYWKIML